MANSEQIIDVDLDANSADLNAAVQKFLQDLKAVKTAIDTIGLSSQNAALAFDRQTEMTLKRLQRGMGVLSTMEKLQNRDKLSPGEDLRLQKQLASQNIRSLQDRELVQKRLDEARLRRVELVSALENNTNRKTRQDLLSQLSLQDHIEARATSRLRAMEQLRQTQMKSTWAQADVEKASLDARTQAWIKFENEQSKAEEKKRRQQEAAYVQIEKDASKRLAVEEKTGAQIVANRQKRQLEIDRESDRLRKKEQMTATERMSIAKKVADLDIRQLRTVAELQGRVSAAREAIDRKTLELQQAKTAEARRQLQAEIQLSQFIESRANRRLTAMGRMDRTLTAAEELRANKLVEEQKIRGIRSVGDLQARLERSNNERRRLSARLETETNNTIRRQLMDRIRLENHIETKIKQRLALLDREERKNARRGSPLGDILSPEYAGAAFARTSVYGGAAMLAYGAFNALQDGARFAVELEDKLANLQAIAGATDSQMGHLSQSILETARNSKYATNELVEATTSLAQAGMTTKEMEGALRDVSNLANASGTDLATSADLMTSALGSFQLQATETGRISDAMVAALNRSKLTVEQVTAAIQYAGATAYEQNIKFEELLGTAGALAQAGIKRGSTIGTGLRQFLVDLQDPSEKLLKQLKRLGLTFEDVDVKTRGLVPVLETLKQAGFGSAQAYGSLETRAAAAYLVLKNNTDTIQELIQAQQEAGVATDAAAMAMDSLSAQWQRFKNNLNEGVARGAADELEFLKDAIRWVSDVIEEANAGWAEHDKAIAEGLRKYDELQQKAKESGDVLQQFWLWFSKENAEAQLMNGTLAETSSRMEQLEGDTKDLNDEFISQMQTIGAVDDTISRLLAQQTRYRNSSKEVELETLSLARQFKDLSGDLINVSGDFDKLIQKMMIYRQEAYATAATTAANRKALAMSRQEEAAQGAREALRAGFNLDATPKLRGLVGAVMTYRRDPQTGQQNVNSAAVSALLDEIQNIKNPNDRKNALDFARSMANLGVATNDRRAAASDESRLKFLGSSSGTKLTNELSTYKGWVDSGVKPQNMLPYESAVDFGNRKSKELLALAAKEQDRAKAKVLLDLAQEYKSLSIEAKDVKESPKTNKRAERALAREQRRQEGAERSIAAAGLKSADIELKEALEILDEPIDLNDLREASQDIHSTLKGWVEARTKAMEAEIKRLDMKGAEAEAFRKEVGREIEARKREVSRAMADAITKMYDKMIETARKAAERQMQPYEAMVSNAEARRSASDRTYNEGVVPDYVRDTQEFSAKKAGEARDQARLEVLETQIESYANALESIQDAIDMVQRGAKSAETDGITPFAKAVEDLGNQDIVVTADRIRQLAEGAQAFSDRDMTMLAEKAQEGQDALAGLRAEADALRLSLEQAVPLTFNEALEAAAQNYYRVNHLNRTFSQNLVANLGGAFQETHQLMTNFWTDMLTKPQEAGQAFANFALGVIDMLQRMAAEALANQIFGTILKGLGGWDGVLSSSTMSSVESVIGANPEIFFDGGLVGSQTPLQRLAGGPIYRGTGGMVNHGVPNRDSVLTALARGEFVLRKNAVDSLGVGLVSDLNRRGAQALQGLGGTLIAPQPARQEMSVYLVAQDEKPQLGPNDVLAIVNKDILKDGQTKKLIRYVAQGG